MLGADGNVMSEATTASEGLAPAAGEVTHRTRRA